MLDVTGQLLVDVFLGVAGEGSVAIILDLDAHRPAALRQEEGRLFQYYGNDCYLLLISSAAIPAVRALAQLQYRRQRRQSGRIAEGRSSDPVLWPKTRIILRGNELADRAFE